MSRNETEQWKLSRQWMIEQGVIPPIHPATKPTADLVDFARCLRDGVYLCVTLNKIKPNCVQFSPRPTMQVTYVRNINAFLTCCYEVFRIQEEYLFEEADLYDVTNFQKVIQTLSRLSWTQQALSHGWEPFPRESEKDIYDQEQESIYANLEDLAFESAQTIEDNSTIYDVVPTEEDEDIYGDESIYAAVVAYQSLPQVIPKSQNEKRHNICMELLETEKSYISVLLLIVETYQAVLKSHLSEEDQILLFMLPGKLLPCHHVLVEGVQQAVDNPQVDLATFFLDQQQGLLQYGIYVATLPTATKKAKQLQESREVGKLLQETMAKSPQRFPLSDLLTIPLQRITKYPLLIKELLKCAEKQVPRNAQEITNLQALLDKMQDIVQYVNEAKRDFEHLKLVMEIEQSINDSKVGVTNLGRFRNDGELKVKSDDEKEAKKKWFFLFDKGLLICNMQKKVWGMGPIRYYMKDVIDTHSIVISDLPNQQQGKKLVYPFKLSATSGSCATGPQSIVCYALAADIKTQWVQSFESAKNIARPALYNHGHHEFELETFSKPTMCSGCKKLLCGSYFQGYMCRHCSVSCHLDCMKTIRKCRAATGEDLNSSHGSTRSSEVRPKSKISVDATLHLSKGEGVPRPGSIFFALEKYDHPLFVSATNNRRALMLAKGEEVEIADANDPNWWEVISLKTGNKGKVPPSYLKKKEDIRPPAVSYSPSPSSPRSPEGETLKNQPYFVGCMSRLEAEQILQDLYDGVFLIRMSDKRHGEFAIALRWKSTPRHIMIRKHANSTLLFVADIKSFNTVQELVEYYRMNSLVKSFPGVDTTLRYPYWEAANANPSRRSVGEAPRRPTSTSAIAPPHSHHQGNNDKRTSLPPIHSDVPMPGSKAVRRTPSGTNIQESVSPPLPSRGDVNGPNNDHFHWCEALFNFNAEYPDELSIRAAGKIKLLSKDTKKHGWWLGEYHGKIGLFPNNYVKLLPS